MIKLNHLAVILVSFILISLLLSFFNIISFELSDILSYVLLIAGVSLVYAESINGNLLLVFIGSVIFLLGVYFLVTENFQLYIYTNISIPLILIISGASLLIIHITTSAKKILLLISVILLSGGVTILITKSHIAINSFLQAFVPVLNFLWPVLIILLVIILLTKRR